MRKEPNQLVELSDGKIGILLESKRYSTQMAIINRSDRKKVESYCWSLQKGRFTFYARCKRSTISLHRLLLGVTDPAIKVDHKNGNGLLNCRYNLRKATDSQNVCNSRTRIDNTSGCKGVSLVDNKWRALITVQGKHILLGRFETFKEAQRAYRSASKIYHGSYSRCA